MRPTTSAFFLALLGFLILHVSPLLGQTAAPKVSKIPFHGKLLAVDTAAQTITIAGKNPRVFHLTPTTRITDGSGAPSTLTSATVGEDVGGSYSKDPAGTMTLNSVRFGAKIGSKAAANEAAAEAAAAAATKPAVVAPTPVAPSAPAPKPVATTPVSATAPAAPETEAAVAKVKKQTFSGKVVMIDADASLVVVHGRADQTFSLTPTTKITDASGKPTTIAGTTAGTKVSGTYSKSADGKTLTVYTLKIGK